ncbi:hypothetical protein FEI13_03945 [Halomonas urmiana]|uniref:Phage baseplate protein n=1 Tax=Halomonas urmiana TaxID=490901 RepID=A0A5R8ML32_9GAMM|nr:hypothetical protein [Halomonas urmiana]TLF52863.1 hypothetical protein FEI13_03945 [Halomonas urmiana]
MMALSPKRLLWAWEHGRRRHPIDRALLLHALAAPDLPPERLADQPLGCRNAALFTLRCAAFGSRLDAWLDCPACGERLEFPLEASQLPPTSAQHAEPLRVAGHRLTRPTSRHLARLVPLDDERQAAMQLLRDCLPSNAPLPEDEAALTDLLEAAEAALEVQDPWAELSLAFGCPACGHQDSASFDIADYLWEEIDARARELLDDVHVLARAYGWSEPQVLALSDARRTAYLERVQA